MLGIARLLRDAAYKKGSDDNISVLLTQLAPFEKIQQLDETNELCMRIDCNT